MGGVHSREFRGSLSERFHAKFIPEPNTGCWLWMGSITGRDERGMLTIGKSLGGKNIYAHRVSWMLFRGEIPQGISVLHTCDVPSCVNPEHLFLGTQLDNMRDCAMKGRIVPNSQKGQECSWTKLTDHAVAEIKSVRLTRKEYAVKFGISYHNVGRIQRGERWQHIAAATE